MKTTYISIDAVFHRFMDNAPPGSRLRIELCVDAPIRPRQGPDPDIVADHYTTELTLDGVRDMSGGFGRNWRDDLTRLLDRAFDD